MADEVGQVKGLRGFNLSNYKSLEPVIIAIGAIVMVFMFILPIPTLLLDFFMSLNLVLTIIILFIVIFTAKPTQFSIFPSLLLITAVYGLAINVCSTRLILTLGVDFDGAMINAFSTFVVGSSGNEGLVTGFVIFIIILAVQVFVITKGATRISEVKARFTLDEISVTIMGIENEYSSGAITLEEAQEKKRQVRLAADFFGNMDGASKFVSGSVKVSIFIVVINILAGLLIGVIFRNESFSNALATYIRFTIGDGLLSQIPTLLVSVSSGLIAAKVESDYSLAEDLTKQFTNDALVYGITAAVLVIMAFLPGFPTILLLLMGVLLGLFAWFLQRKNTKKTTIAASTAQQGKSAGVEQKGQNVSKTSPIVPLDPLSLEIGIALIPLVDKEKGAELFERITRIRRTAALELGLVAPEMRIVDNMLIEPDEYCFKIRGVEVARGKIRMESYLAINSGDISEEIPGERTLEPTFGLPAIWIPESSRARAEMLGYTVVDPPSIIATHLTEIIKRKAADILDRQMVQDIVDALHEKKPAVVDDVMNGSKLRLGLIQKVLQSLLSEQVSIRDIVTIFETISDYITVTSDITVLTSKVRQALAPQICAQYADAQKTIHALLLSADLTQKLLDNRVDTINGPLVGWNQATQRQWLKELADTFIGIQKQGYQPIILTTEEVRPLVKSATIRDFPNLVVLAATEITSDTQVEALGEITL